jgi:D-alanyl-lipoteichoic acid acyltransferase DltB (MBOAT superfamily)
MAAKYILPLLAAAFLLAALWRLSRDGFKFGPASRTWLTIAVLFGVVSGWLFFSPMHS